MRRSLHKTLAAAALALTASPAMATPIAQVSGSTLTGFSDVEVNGISYDVTFQHGSCDAVFGAECAPPGHFTFSNQGDALAASRALSPLLGSVFASGKVQSIAGCQTGNTCYVVTPYAAAGVGGNASFSVTYATPSGGTGDQSVTNSDFGWSYISPTVITSAVWSVPEPASAALLLSAAAALLATRRRKQPS